MEKRQVHFSGGTGRFEDDWEIDIPIDTDFVKRKYKDIQYAPGSERRKLDIYLPNDGDGPFPVIMDIYGGGWCFGNRSSFKMEPALNLLKRGFAVVSPDYTLSTRAAFPTPVYELKTAIRFIKAHAEQYHLLPDKMALMGESAGAHLAALCAASASMGCLEFDEWEQSGLDSTVQAVIAVYCPTELTGVGAQFRALGVEPEVPCDEADPNAPLALFLGRKAIRDVPELARAASPITYVNSHCPAFLFLHGSKDRTVPLLQSWNMAAKLIDAIGEDKVEHHVIEGAEHSIFDFETEEVYDMEANFLRKHL